jgi:hypothetical protein
MQPAHFHFGGGNDVTVLNPFVAAVMVLGVILIFRLSRKYVFVPVLLIIMLTPKGQELLLAGVHFNVFRIIFLAGLARWMMLRKSSPLPGGFNSIDRAVTWCAIALCVVASLQWMEIPATVKACGDLLDALGCYFVMRGFIRDREDMRRAIQILALIAIIVGAEMMYEQFTRQDLFGQLGGTAAVPEMRDGRVRSQGPFRQSIPAGVYGATLVPLLVWLWSDPKSRKFVVPGMAGATIMAFTCHSSTATGALAAGVFALCLWPLRSQTRLMRYGIVLVVVGLEVAMKGPVWSILEHINLTGASESFHRYELINTFINHFGDWWLLGTHKNASWGWEMIDTSNQYVTYGLGGGLITFIMLIVILSRCFGRLGATRKLVEGNHSEEWVRWCLGAALFAYVAAFFGIDMFDQLEFTWLTLLALIAVTTSHAEPLPEDMPVKEHTMSVLGHDSANSIAAWRPVTVRQQMSTTGQPTLPKSRT